MSGPLTLRTTLAARGPAAAIMLDDDQVATLTGGPKTAPVTVTIGERSFAGRIARMGGENLIGLNKAVRAEMGVEVGDTVEVVIELDAGRRHIAVPEDLAAALAEAGARAAFDGLAPSHRKEYVRWVEEAKRPETRTRRVAEAVTRVAEGRPRR